MSLPLPTTTELSPGQFGQWATVEAASRMLGLSKQHFRDRYMVLLDDEEHIRRRGRASLIHFPSLMRRIVDDKIEIEAKAQRRSYQYG